MRIALLHYTFAPVVGGVETVMAAHAEIFRSMGHSVSIVCQRGDAGDVSERILPTELDHASVASALQDADIVFAHNVMTMPFNMRLTSLLWDLAAKLPGTRFVSWIHDLAALNPDYTFDRKADPWSLLSQASPDFEHVAVSSHRAELFTSLTGVLPRVVPNGIDPVAILGLTPSVSDFINARNLWERHPVLIHPARFVPRKNIELSLDVTAALRALGHNAALLITGACDAQNAAGESYRSNLIERRRALELTDHAFFVSDTFTVTSADLVSLYGVADALLFPSHHEGFGLPILEAGLHRLPIFCPDSAPMNSLLPIGPHYISPGATASEIGELIASTVTHNAAHQTRRSVIDRYSWETVARQHLIPLLAARPNTL